MILAIDIGNTGVTCGVFRGRRLVRRFAFQTASCNSTAALARRLSKKSGRGPAIDGIAIASVVPQLDRIFRKACAKAFGERPIFATPGTIGITIRGYDRRQVGADRLVNALAAFERYGRALIVVDAGTAVTFDVVDSKGRFIGGAIAPGMRLMAEALHEGTAKLPLVSAMRPSRAPGRNTEEAVRSGIYYGLAGMIDRIVREISREKRLKPIVIATGGHASLVAKISETIERVHPDLTLEGLHLVWKRNVVRRS